jgi:hypothetical protein
MLDVMEKPTVRYCIPDWLRDEQIRLAIKRAGVGRIAPAYEPRAEPVAVVGFGPSLEETWEQVRGFAHVISCSGAHKFLVERGVIPTWHVEVDPREHKVGLMGPPQRDTTYLIASACHPKVFEHLAGHTVLLWHVFDPTDTGLRLLPRGEWAITGGCDVGLRALSLAAFLGFRDLHVFGMDGSARERRHAAEHPNGGKHFEETVYGGVTYKTTHAMLAAAQQVAHELDQMPKVRAKFYGDGLIQHMMRTYVPKKNDDANRLTNTVGFARPTLISAEYAQLNAQLHRDNLAYGVGGGRHARAVLKLVDVLQKDTKGQVSVLDYGCGKGYLGKELPFPIYEYDPAVPEKAETPRPADIVACTDVLEHIEPEHLWAVLDDLRRVTKRFGYFVIHTGPSTKLLADGRNAHLIQHDRIWWKKKLKKFFSIAQIWDQSPLLHVLVIPKPKQPKQQAA